MNGLGEMYEFGHSVERDFTTALNYYRTRRRLRAPSPE